MGGTENAKGQEWMVGRDVRKRRGVGKGEEERDRQTDGQTGGGGATDRPSIKTSLDSNENRTVSIRLKNQ